RLHSDLQVFPFRADSYGNVKQDITVPRNAGIGGHTIQVCWASTCHLTAILQVREPVALVTPAPAETPSPSTVQTPQPSAGPTPSASSSPSPYITVPEISKTKGFVVGFHFFRAGTWVVDVIQSGKSYLAGTASVTAGGSYSRSGE